MKDSSSKKESMKDSSSKKESMKDSSSKNRTPALIGLLAGIGLLGLALAPTLRKSWAEANRINKEVDHFEKKYSDKPHARDLNQELTFAIADVKKSPDDLNARLHYAAILGQLRRYKEAQIALVEVVKLAPSKAEPHIALSEVYESNQILDLGIAEARRAVELEPNNPRAITRLGYVYIGMDWNTAALNLLKAPCARFPNDVPLHIIYSQTLYQIQSYPAALENIMIAQRLDPENLNLNGPLIDIYKQLGNYKEAERVADHAISLDPVNAYFHTQKSEIERSMNNLATSEEEARMVLKYHPDTLEAHYQLALTLKQKGNRKEAIEEFGKVVADSPNYSSAMKLLVTLLAADGKNGEAAIRRREYESHQKELDISTQASIRVTNSPEDHEAHYLLGLSYARRGLYPRAAAEFRESLLLYPLDKRPLKVLEKTLKSMNRNEEAQVIEKAMKK